jgi:hypothetical protein
VQQGAIEVQFTRAGDESSPNTCAIMFRLFFLKINIDENKYYENFLDIYNIFRWIAYVPLKHSFGLNVRLIDFLTPFYTSAQLLNTK